MTQQQRIKYSEALSRFMAEAEAVDSILYKLPFDPGYSTIGTSPQAFDKTREMLGGFGMQFVIDPTLPPDTAVVTQDKEIRALIKFDEGVVYCFKSDPLTAQLRADMESWVK